jgi:uncharacterized protein YndB with AHSA1/START domain
VFRSGLILSDNPMRAALLSLALLVGTDAARAAIVDSQPDGFEGRETVDIAAPPAKVWAAITRIGAWWDPVHTYSGDAAALSLDPTLGGCFCERLPSGGGVRHMQVVYVRPGETIRLEGALGPLQALGAVGHMTLSLSADAGHTTLSMTYDVGGYAKGGLGDLAKPVDSVLGVQVGRLKRYVETGQPA